MRLDILARLLESKNVGIEGTSIFVFQMPADCPQGVLLKLPLSGIPVDHYLPGFYDSRMQMIVRAQSQSAGDTLVRQAVAALVHDITTDYYDQPGSVFAMRINHLLQDNLPIRFPRSDGNGIEWSINFKTCFTLP